MITMHPGEYLEEAYLEPLQMSQTDLAKHLHVSKSAVSRLIAGEADLSALMAVRLSKVFGLSAEAWMAMQTQHSLRLARKELTNTEFKQVAFEPDQALADTQGA